MKTPRAIAQPAPLAGVREWGKHDLAPAQPAALVILEWLMMLGVWAIPMRAPILDILGSRVAPFAERSLTQFVAFLTVPLLPLIARRAIEAARKVAFATFLLAFMYGTMVLLANGHVDSGSLRLATQQFWAVYIGVLSCVVAQRPESRDRLVTAYLVGWACLSVVSVAAFRTGQFEFELGEFGRPSEAVRISLFHENTNWQSIALASGMPVAVTRIINTRSSVRAGALMVALALSFYAALLGSSRTCILVILLGSLFVATWNLAQIKERRVVKPDRASVVKMISVVAIAGLLLWVAIEDDLLSRFVTSIAGRFEDLADATDDGDRSHVAGMALELAFKTPMGIGLGFAESALRINPHNEYLRIYLECGILGLALMIAGLSSIVALVVRIYRVGGDSAIPGALFVTLVAAGVGQDLMLPLAWFLIGVTVVDGEVARPHSAHPASVMNAAHNLG